MPLAHILAPQLFKKAQQIEADLGHAPMPGAPIPGGYLDSAPSVDALKARLQTAKTVKQGDGQGGIDYDKRAKKLGFEKKPEEYDPRYQEPLYNYQGAAAGLPLGHRGKLAAAGMLPTPHVADMQAYEQGNVMTPPVDVKPYKKGTPLTFAPGEPVAVTESGYGVDKKGKRLGYLDQEALHPGIRYLDRRPTDIGLTGGDAHGGVHPSYGQDADAQGMLGQMYGSYLRDYQGNNNRFFNEMFYKAQSPQDVKAGKKPEKLTPKEIENVKKGVKVLLELQNGTKT